jgi:hypothetical protein
MLWAGRKERTISDDHKDRSARRERHTREFEANQQDLRTCIAQSKQLVDEADAMIRRHRDECDAAEES